MYMREMGSVELLTREGEIEIAKRIEDGLKHMIQAISSCPTTIEEILRLADLIERDEMRIDELVDGLVDADEEELAEQEAAEEAEEEARGRGDHRGGRRRDGERRPRAPQAGLPRPLQQDPPPVQEDEEDPGREGLSLARLQGPAGRHLQRAARDPLHREAGRAPLQRASPPGRARSFARARDHGAQHAQRQHAARALHQGVPGQRDEPQVGGRGDRLRQGASPRRSSASSRR